MRYDSLSRWQNPESVFIQFKKASCFNHRGKWPDRKKGNRSPCWFLPMYRTGQIGKSNSHRRYRRYFRCRMHCWARFGYLLDAVAGIIGGPRRWRSMPWIVILFGLAVGILVILLSFFKGKVKHRFGGGWTAIWKSNPQHVSEARK